MRRPRRYHIHGCIGLTTVPANHRPTLPACSTSTHYHAPFSSSWLQSSDELSGKSPHKVWRNMPFRVTLHIQPGVPWGASRQARFFQHFGPFFDSTRACSFFHEMGERMRSRSCACATGKCIRRCVVRVCMSDIPTCVRLPSENGCNMCGSKCLYAFSESIFKPKLLAQHHVYAWFAGLPRKDGLISYRSERTRMRSTPQCDLPQSPLFLRMCSALDRTAWHNCSTYLM